MQSMNSEPAAKERGEGGRKSASLKALCRAGEPLDVPVAVLDEPCAIARSSGALSASEVAGRMVEASLSGRHASLFVCERLVEAFEAGSTFASAPPPAHNCLTY